MLECNWLTGSHTKLCQQLLAAEVKESVLFLNGIAIILRLLRGIAGKTMDTKLTQDNSSKIGSQLFRPVFLNDSYSLSLWVTVSQYVCDYCSITLSQTEVSFCLYGRLLTDKNFFRENIWWIRLNNDWSTLKVKVSILPCLTVILVPECDIITFFCICKKNSFNKKGSNVVSVFLQLYISVSKYLISHTEMPIFKILL